MLWLFDYDGRNESDEPVGAHRRDCRRYLLGVFFQNRRIDDLRDSMNKRFDDLNSRFDDVNSWFDDMRDLVKSEVRRLEDRIGRPESPIVRQK